MTHLPSFAQTMYICVIKLTIWLSPSWRQRKALVPQRSHNPLDVRTWSSRYQWLTVACDTEVTLSLTLTIVPLTWHLVKQTLVLTFHTGLPQKAVMPTAVWRCSNLQLIWKVPTERSLANVILALSYVMSCKRNKQTYSWNIKKQMSIVVLFGPPLIYCDAEVHGTICPGCVF